MAPDTVTAGGLVMVPPLFYNYIFYTVAGFTEHDTFRAIKSGKGKCLVVRRYDGARKTNPDTKNMYLDTVGLISETVKVINEMPKIWRINQ